MPFRPGSAPVWGTGASAQHAMQERKERAGVLALVPALIPERECEHREHDKQHPHSGSFAHVLQPMITNTATVLAAGTSVARPRFIADEIGDSDPTVGTSCCGRESRGGVYGGADAVSVLGRRAVRIDEDVVGRVRARTRDLGELGDRRRRLCAVTQHSALDPPAGGSAAQAGPLFV